MASTKRKPDEAFTAPTGARGVVLSQLSPRGKQQARLSCVVVGCEETHVRESSDWHQSGRCLLHAGSSPRSVKKVHHDDAHTYVSESVCLERIAAHERRERATFDCYAFADYRGDKNDAGGVVLAVAMGTGAVELIEGVSSRARLAEFLPKLLSVATKRRLRVLFGQDHQYGIPAALLAELGLGSGDWRTRMQRLFVDGVFGRHAVAGHAGAFAGAVNTSLEQRGSLPYFWSATNGARYGLPSKNPRPKNDASQRRLCEERGGLRFGFSRLGDPGSVGGQTIVGLARVLAMLQENANIQVWPFDGLSLCELCRGHVALEIYPSAVRAREVAQSDENDATACVTWAQRHDLQGTLARQIDLTSLSDEEQARARIEGWIAGITTASNGDQRP